MVTKLFKLIIWLYIITGIKSSSLVQNHENIQMQTFMVQILFQISLYPLHGEDYLTCTSLTFDATDELLTCQRKLSSLDFVYHNVAKL